GPLPALRHHAGSRRGRSIRQAGQDLKTTSATLYLMSTMRGSGRGAKEPGMSVRVAINGFGRIGRNVLRAIAEAERQDVEVVAINDLAPVETNAHLLRYDSVHGRFPGQVKVVGDTISVGNGAIKVTAIKDPATLPWKELGIDIALECTGIFTSKEKAGAHLTDGG